MIYKQYSGEIFIKFSKLEINTIYFLLLKRSIIPEKQFLEFYKICEPESWYLNYYYFLKDQLFPIVSYLHHLNLRYRHTFGNWIGLAFIHHSYWSEILSETKFDLEFFLPKNIGEFIGYKTQFEIKNFLFRERDKNFEGQPSFIGFEFVEKDFDKFFEKSPELINFPENTNISTILNRFISSIKIHNDFNFSPEFYERKYYYFYNEELIYNILKLLWNCSISNEKYVILFKLNSFRNQTDYILTSIEDYIKDPKYSSKWGAIIREYPIPKDVDESVERDTNVFQYYIPEVKKEKFGTIASPISNYNIYEISPTIKLIQLEDHQSLQVNAGDIYYIFHPQLSKFYKTLCLSEIILVQRTLENISYLNHLTTNLIIEEQQV